MPSGLEILETAVPGEADANAGSDRRIRVLGIVPEIDRGGGERIAVQILCGLDKRRFDVAGISLFDSARADVQKELGAAGVAMHFLGKRPGLDVRMIRGIQRIIKDFRPHIVHTHLGALRYVIPSLLFHRVPAVLHTFHRIADRDRGSLNYWINALAFRLGVNPVAISGAVQESIARVYGIHECRLVCNGVPVNSIRAARGARCAWRAANGFGDRDVLFVCVARLEPVKNHSLALEAFARGPARSSAARLVLAGEGELRSELRRQCRELEIAGRVLFVGQRQDIPDLLSAADVFVLSSLSEANPICVMEAMAAGLPIVATQVGGVPELVRSGVDGILVANGDSRALGEAMCELLDDPARRARLGASASQRADGFGLDAMVRSYESFYAGCIAA